MSFVKSEFWQLDYFQVLISVSCHFNTGISGSLDLSSFLHTYDFFLPNFNCLHNLKSSFVSLPYLKKQNILTKYEHGTIAFTS